MCANRTPQESYESLSCSHSCLASATTMSGFADRFAATIFSNVGIFCIRTSDIHAVNHKSKMIFQYGYSDVIRGLGAV